jgi:hypothetical protein
MSSIFSQELAASPSASSEPECERKPSARSIPIAKPCCESTGQMSLFTEMSESLPARRFWPTPMPSDVDGGRTTKGRHRQNETGIRRQALMSSAAASPARTSASPERARALAALVRDYGQSTPELLARYDRATSSWRTSQLCLDGGYSEFSETLPRSGMWASGTAYLLPPLVRLIDAIESGSLATPQARDYRTGEGHRWNTPEKRSRNLNDQIAADVGYKMWPTPTAQDASNNGGASQYDRNSLPLNAAIGGSLNPTWVEWLLGFPLGWTVCEPSATPSSRKSPSSSGGPS